MTLNSETAVLSEISLPMYTASHPKKKGINFRKAAILKELGQIAIFKIAVKLIFKTIFTNLQMSTSDTFESQNAFFVILHANDSTICTGRFKETIKMTA